MSVVDPRDDDLAKLLKELKDFHISPVGRESEMKDVVARRVQIGSVQREVGQVGGATHHVDFVQIRLHQLGRRRNGNLEQG